MSEVVISGPAGAADAPESLSKLETLTGAELERLVFRQLEGIGRDDLERLKKQSDLLMQDLGMIFYRYPVDSTLAEVSFDPFPKIIEKRDWDFICAGVIQRLEIWNCFLRDIYDTQEVLRSGTLPCRWVYTDPNYQRSAVNLKVAGNLYVHLAAFDLIQGAGGEWWVAEDQLSDMTGAAYALQCRVVREQVFPDLVPGLPLQSPFGFPTRLCESLKRQAVDGAVHRQVVVLSPGRSHVSAGEHGYLAQKMGVPLVENDDLIVLNSRVHLKTIKGLEPIDVIYRGVHTRNLDALEFAADGDQGISGLMMCVRKGTVSVCNAVGSELVNNRLIGSQLKKLARFYLDQDIMLPTIDRRWCGDPDCLQEALANFGECLVSRLGANGPDSQWDCGAMDERALTNLRERMLQAPEDYLVEYRLQVNEEPILDRGAGASRHTGLRLITLANDRGSGTVLPLTRYAVAPGSRLLKMGSGGGFKDTWILAGSPDQEEETPLEVRPPRTQLRLSSRSANHFFWLGRYLERAEDIIRILRTVRQVRYERYYHRGQRVWDALAETLALVMGQPTESFKGDDFSTGQTAIGSVLLDSQRVGSVADCLRKGWENGLAVREILPPKASTHLARLAEDLRSATEGISDCPEALGRREEVRRIEETLMLDLDALTGAMTTHLLRDDRWHFWRLGVCLERGLQTLLVIRQMAFGNSEAGWPPATEKRLVDVILRMLACSEAYRVAFEGYSHLAGALRVVLHERGFPRSVIGCLSEVQEILEAIIPERAFFAAEKQRRNPLEACRRLLGRLEFFGEDYTLNLDAGLRWRLLTWIDELIQGVRELCLQIVDRCFHHQHFELQ